MDEIPVYREQDLTSYLFSGKRSPYSYKGMTKSGGFRGLYVASDGTIINSDLNGSANILRKAYPVTFLGGEMPDFQSVKIIRHPGMEHAKKNHAKQKLLARNSRKDA